MNKMIASSCALIALGCVPSCDVREPCEKYSIGEVAGPLDPLMWISTTEPDPPGIIAIADLALYPDLTLVGYSEKAKSYMISHITEQESRKMLDDVNRICLHLDSIPWYDLEPGIPMTVLEIRRGQTWFGFSFQATATKAGMQYHSLRALIATILDRGEVWYSREGTLTLQRPWYHRDRGVEWPFGVPFPSDCNRLVKPRLLVSKDIVHLFRHGSLPIEIGGTVCEVRLRMDLPQEETIERLFNIPVQRYPPAPSE